VFHIDAIRKQPEFSVADVVVIDMGGSDIHKTILVAKTKKPKKV